MKINFRFPQVAISKFNIKNYILSSQNELQLRANFREIAFLINEKQSEKLSAGLLYSTNLLSKIYKYVFEFYLSDIDKNVLKNQFSTFANTINEFSFMEMLTDFSEKFQPEEAMLSKISLEDFLWKKENERFIYENEIIQTFISYLNIENPALKNLSNIINYDSLASKENYHKYIHFSKEFYRKQKPVINTTDILSFLYEPILKYPNNLQEQLEFIRENWKEILKDSFDVEILKAIDIFKEEYVSANFGFGGNPTFIPNYKVDKFDETATIGKSGFNYAKSSQSDYSEFKAFTDDTHWMPNVVMIAKNIFVWLDQLSKKYSMEIRTLDKIPDEELLILHERNINSLWLIGVWERSDSSRIIKHLRGNIDAVSSAYSLYDYQIAQQLGGEFAFQQLNEKAKRFGIRLAADMVPNHTGIFSKWIEEHPEYFIQRTDLPFPNYQFTGENLSSNPDLLIQIEDGYWTNSDASVVFKYHNYKNGETKYIYHGNDGTNMPWNDTAQLDILKQKVREAVIQKIMDVARKFSVIRFDAAMTLTKKHFSRLWYPQPGLGGDIPTRTDYSLTKEQFDELFPVEFWREVVDRINTEMPETLLLAEAFWLMEGYFVRTLGMHRVYNSAFMHMFMLEENEKYHGLIKNTLEFEPEILKRYVNFMSNPDEETAIKQFGTGDKYFGVLLMMITLPGLPMFAHGQVEGFHEKYGMEYQRAYYEEFENENLVNRHKAEIFPILSKRYIFSEVTHFWFYNCFNFNGNVNHNVFAFSNQFRNEKALVLFNNKYDRAEGIINLSAAKLVDENLKQVTISDALEIPKGENLFVKFKEMVTDKDYLYSVYDFTNGMEIMLNGFEYRVFTNFEIIYDETGIYQNLYSILNKNGVDSIQNEIKKQSLSNIHNAIINLFDSTNFEHIISIISQNEKNTEELEKNLVNLENRFHFIVSEIVRKISGNVAKNRYEFDFDLTIHAISNLYKVLAKEEFEIDINLRRNYNLMFDHNFRKNFIIFVILGAIKEIQVKTDFKSIYEIEPEILLSEPLYAIFYKLDLSSDEIEETKQLIGILSQYCQTLCEIHREKGIDNLDFNVFANELLKALDYGIVQNFLQVNDYKGITYFRKENFEDLASWFYTIYLVESQKWRIENEVKNHEIDMNFRKSIRKIAQIIEISNESKYNFTILKQKIAKVIS